MKGFCMKWYNQINSMRTNRIREDGYQLIFTGVNHGVHHRPSDMYDVYDPDGNFIGSLDEHKLYDSEGRSFMEFQYGSLYSHLTSHPERFLNSIIEELLHPSVSIPDNYEEYIRLTSIHPIKKRKV